MTTERVGYPALLDPSKVPCQRHGVGPPPPATSTLRLHHGQTSETATCSRLSRASCTRPPIPETTIASRVAWLGA